MSKKFQFASAGSVSTGTMRSQDLIESFSSELRFLGHRSKELTRIEKRYNTAINGEFGEDDEYFNNEVSSFDLESLVNMLDSHCLPYFYFGSHPGDGADYGFWISESIEYDYDGLKVSDTSEVKDSYIGEVLHVNDHGNMTLYTAKKGKLTEVWSVV